ncbi:hypothetical protein B7463_g1095, partial [Scytalidium lignicola]
MATNIENAPVNAKDLSEVVEPVPDTRCDGDDVLPTEEECHTLRRAWSLLQPTTCCKQIIEVDGARVTRSLGRSIPLPLLSWPSVSPTTEPPSSITVTNFIQQPLPPGSRTGAGFTDGQSGALNMGQQASTGIGTFNQFWVFLMPLAGAYVADAHLGRYRTICLAIAIALFGHILLVIAAIPPVITKPHSSLGTFIVGLIIMGVGTGSFKPNISPLIVEQIPLSRMVVSTLPSGQRVIIDPSITASRIYHYFYLVINIGALTGQIGMVYSEKYRTPPQGSVLGKAMRIWLRGFKGRLSLNPVASWRHLNDGTFWEISKPSNVAPSERPSWMTFDDSWVDEVRRGFAACSVFCWYPLYWITYNQLNNNLTSQEAVMKLNGLPNDILSNLDPFALVVLIPICDLLLYPFLRKLRINFSPIKKITFGFYTGSAAMIWAAVIQAYIYKKSICGNYAAGILPGSLGGDGETSCPPVDINVWAQTGAYVLIAISEIFASITSLEYAFSKAPRNMRSMVQAVALMTSAISAAIGEAFVSLSTDPLLVWNYGAMAVLSFIGGTILWFQYRQLDKDDDALNQLPEGQLIVAKDIEDQNSVSPVSTPIEIKEKN